MGDKIKRVLDFWGWIRESCFRVSASLAVSGSRPRVGRRAPGLVWVPGARRRSGGRSPPAVAAPPRAAEGGACRLEMAVRCGNGGTIKDIEPVLSKVEDKKVCTGVR